MQKTTYQSIRIFESPTLEKLTHVHPITPLVLWGPIVIREIWRSLALHRFGVGAMLGFAVSGLLVWTLTEYLVHRFLFHYPARSRVGRRLVFLFHGLHHDDPVDPTRLVMPPSASVLLASFFYGLFGWLLGPFREPFFAFFLVGYLCYDYIHLWVHWRTPPRSRVGRYLKQYHMVHHYKNPQSRWGVSSPLWDFVFGTSGARVKSRPVAPSI